jgi:two-component system sensor histidine kinase CpxA
LKTPFPLFAKLLLWFFVNLLILIVGLALMVRVQFGSLDNWLLPASSQNQIQAMTATLIGNLAHSNREDWTEQLAQLSAAYKMDFSLYDFHSQWLAGSETKLPDEVQHAIRFAREGHPTPGGGGQGPGMAPAGPPAMDSPPEGGPPGFNLRQGEPPPGPPPRSPNGGRMPEFPKSVIRTNSPPGYWLIVRLPPEPLKSNEPITLVGMTPALGISPLLFNPKPWIAVVVGIILFSIIFWFPLARNLTTSIVKMTRATESIAEGRFDIQLADSRRDELGRLGHAINRMAGRLKDFVTGQKRFLGDAAHELCSPLVRMEIALGILEERVDEHSLSLVRDVREEVTHMRKLANDLLSFSKAALGESHLKLEAVSVVEVVEAARELEKSRDGLMQIHVPYDLKVWGNFELLYRAVANLLRNAARYAGDAGPIWIEAWREGDLVFVTVSDEGPGVSPPDIEKLFDPFYRVDSSRTSETGGVGLGLAIVKTCVEACRGVVTAANRDPHGLEVRLRLHHFAE